MPERRSIIDRFRASLPNTMPVLGRFVEGFLDQPFVYTLRLLAIILLIQASLSAIGGLFGIPSLEVFDWPVEVLFWVFVAWVLVRHAWSRLMVGTFLLIVFLLSVTLVLIPRDEIVRLLADFVAVETGYLTGNQPLAQPGLASIEIYLARALAVFLTSEAPFFFTLVMGALGSSIMITRQFIQDFERQRPAWYLYRLVQGMLTALLVMYGIAAGMIGVGDENPITAANFEDVRYLIGFLSALAGLFSEQAFVKLHDVSKTIFGKPDTSAEHQM